MQGGVYGGYKTKKALKDAVKAGADPVLYSTALLGNSAGWEGKASDLPVGTTFVVVGPDPYKKRNWYAAVKKNNGGQVVVS